jgi:hypothetical protein
MATEDPSLGGEGGGVAGRRFGRFVHAPGVRRLAFPRILLAMLAGAGVVGSFVVLGSFAFESLSASLHRQPVYSFEFRAIGLDPPPPAWYRGGAPAFLERVRSESKEPERQSVLDLDLERLARAFRLDCWVRQVVRVRRSYPNQVVVRLVYREPVAFVTVREGRTIVLDQDGVVVPRKDIEPGPNSPLIQVFGLDLAPGSSREGETVKRTSEIEGIEEVDEAVVAGARLAAFLRTVQSSVTPGPEPMGRFSIHAGDRNNLWIQYGDSLLFRWREPPGRETPGELPATSKWRILREWIEKNGPAALNGAAHHFDITRAGIRPID